MSTAYVTDMACAMAAVPGDQRCDVDGYGDNDGMVIWETDWGFRGIEQKGLNGGSWESGLVKGLEGEVEVVSEE